MDKNYFLNLWLFLIVILFFLSIPVVELQGASTFSDYSKEKNVPVVIIGKPNGFAEISVYDVCVKNRNHLWIVGEEVTNRGNQGVILYSSNGGVTWERQFTKFDTLLNDILFINSDLGFAIGNTKQGNGVILKSEDRGKTWSTSYVEANGALLEIHFITSERGWILNGNGSMFLTFNSGKTWERVNIDKAKRITTFDFVDKFYGLVVGNDGQVFKTDNGGKTWTSISRRLIKILGRIQPSQVDFKEVKFTSPNVGYIGGELLVKSKKSNKQKTYNYHGFLLKTVDGGKNWTQIVISKELGFTSAELINDNEIWVVTTWGWSTGIILHTVDGGKVWNRIPIPNNGGRPFRIYFDNTNNGWLLNSFGMNYDFIFSTSDNGETWHKLNWNIYDPHI